MMDLIKQVTYNAATPINSGAILSGLIGVTILNGNQPYPANTISPSNLAVSVNHS